MHFFATAIKNANNSDYERLSPEFIESQKLGRTSTIKLLEWQVFETRFLIDALEDKINTYQPTVVAKNKSYLDIKKTNEIAFIFSGFLGGLILSILIVYISNPKRRKSL